MKSMKNVLHAFLLLKKGIKLMTEKYHRAFGCYGIIGNKKDLVVIKKLGGPYINRYDLPGGSLEDGEELNHALVREVKEETGLSVLDFHQIGVTSFRYPWDYEKWHFNQHICVFYEVTNTDGSLAAEVDQFEGQDALGAVRVSLDQLNLENSSPLVLKAKEYLLKRNSFSLADQTFKKWPILKKAVF